MPELTSTSTRPEMALGVVGAGRWGRHWVRVCGGLRAARLAAVCDRDATRERALGRVGTAVPWFETPEAMLRHCRLDAVVVATPTSSHAEVALAALAAGCHVLVEKPLAASVADAVKVAGHPGARVMVGHLLRYHPAIVRIHQLVQAGQLGAVTHVLCERMGAAVSGREETAWWALAPHDISIMRFLLGGEPLSVQAASMARGRTHPEDFMAAMLMFPGNVLGVVRVGGSQPIKVRRITVVGERRSVTFTDGHDGPQLLHYDSAVVAEDSLALRAASEPVQQEVVERTEPLLLQAQHFVDRLHDGAGFASDAREGLAVVRVLEAGSRALATGRPVSLTEP